ncbi:MAG TPA: hypothetical protein VN176_02135 [Verrucomicrobiae bacterium]|jgi:hypothetical protein|nr:hypothetical protein [Verrucomicrobiae bacterium]
MPRTMTRITSGSLALVALASLLTAVQAAALPGDNTRSAVAHAKGVNLSGKVSDDGQTFLTDDDNKWIVSNAGALKGQEGRYVTVKCRMDLTRRAIHVLSVHQDQAELKYTGDSAFHR